MTDRQKIVDSVANRLREVVPEIREGSPGEGKDLREYATFDSLGILEVLVWLEGEFGVSIPDEELMVENFNSIGKMVDYVLANR
ncbi:acyl carrier protein [Streptomyces pathocidini]|uniref:Acyl carrier protein n=1 Tax=Streptomyces pathocidini TaxID=1650571 RepID=A0ABW7UJ30_9ACTN|nr:acyl carrier protein [Streptomyces pathocidini]